MWVVKARECHQVVVRRASSFLQHSNNIIFWHHIPILESHDRERYQCCLRTLFMRSAMASENSFSDLLQLHRSVDKFQLFRVSDDASSEASSVQLQRSEHTSIHKQQVAIKRSLSDL